MINWDTIEFLAYKVLDWYEFAEDGDSPRVWHNQDGEYIARFSWNPFRSIEDAMKLLDAVDKFKLEKLSNMYIAHVGSGLKQVWESAETPEKAISLAVLKYNGYKGE